MSDYDVIVIGAGPVGENVADRARQNGLSAVLIEDELVGGSCSYWACMPSKGLLRPGAALRAAQAVAGSREAVTGALDAEAVFERRNRIVHDWSDESQIEWAHGAGIDVLRGRARLDRERRVVVTTKDGVRTLDAAHAVCISTGSDPKIPPIEGLDQIELWTSRDATSAKRVPESLAIVGGGVVATEMATAYASLGASVTVIARSGLLTRAEPFAGEMVVESLRALGARVLVDTNAVHFARSAEGTEIELDNGETFTAERVLIATGRKPRTGDLGLETVGLSPGEWLQTDDTMRVQGTDWLYATGDVCHRALLTHQGKYQARAAGDVISARAEGEPVDDRPWGRHTATADHAAVPQVAFTDPEVASVGLTAEQASAAGHDIRVVDLDLSTLAGASVHDDDYFGRARMVVDRQREVIVGMTFVGRDLAELLHSATIAIVGEVPLERLWHAVPAFPTLSEAWLRLLEAYGRP